MHVGNGNRAISQALFSEDLGGRKIFKRDEGIRQDMGIRVVFVKRTKFVCIAAWSPCSFGCLQDTVAVAQSQTCSTNGVKREGETLLAVK